MKWVLEKWNQYAADDTHYFWQFRNFDISTEEHLTFFHIFVTYFSFLP